MIDISEINSSKSIKEYKDTMARVISLYYPNINSFDLEKALNYSINKRYKEYDVDIENNYNHKNTNMTLLQLTDYIKSREPVVTSYGVLFKKHGEVPNPLAMVIQGFLDKRKQNKDMMFSFPKGSDEWEKYNLLQQLDKIDVNGLYGVLGMYTSLIYNVYVASSITSEGKALVSSAGVQFEMFLANSVKFGSLNEVATFIDNVISERKNRKYNDRIVLDRDITPEECFSKVIFTCGYRWFPEEDDMDIIWNIIYNLPQEDINRVYYKNNLYEFINNQSMTKALIYILNKLDEPYLNPLKCPKEIIAELDEFTDTILEYVYYGHQIIDRVDRMDQMIKHVCLISDTDSTIISLDAWYRCVLDKIKGRDFKILHQSRNALYELEDDEFGDITDKRWKKAIKFEEPELDYDFYNDEIVELEHSVNPLVILPQDNLRYSIINILAYILDKVINDYMEKFTINSHSYRGEGKCKILMKNEFLFQRALLTSVKKSYATIQELQEGNKIPKGMSTELDVKGIACMAKSSLSDNTRNGFKKILFEDILKTPAVDQMKVVKHLAIMEKQMMNSLQNGSKDYYKPLIIKSIKAYDNPMRIQGIKASIVWNSIRDEDLPLINLEERNPIDVVKVIIDDKTIEKVKDIYPELYVKCKRLLENPDFKGLITSIAIPKDTDVPKWLEYFIDYNQIINDNLSGFPIESIGISRLGNTSVNWSNMLKL